MNTYNFLIILGKTQFDVEVNSKTEDEAIDIIRKEYPIDEGYYYILM